MLNEYDFAVIQLRYIEAAAVEIPSFRPDGLDPAAIGGRIAAAAPIRADYVVEKQNISDARLVRRNAVEALHDGSVSFLGQATNRFRADRALVERLGKLPKEDRNFADSLTRADAIINFWPKLPLVGTPAAPWKYGAGTADVGLADYTALRDAAKAADAAIPGVDQGFQAAEGAMHVQLAAMEDFARAAISYGRDRYAEGTAEREIIEAIPGESPATPPGTAVIEFIGATTEGAVLLKFKAAGATSFDVLRRVLGSGDPYGLIGADLIVKTFTDLDVQIGTTYEYIVLGRNSRGDGAASAPGTAMVPLP